MIKISRFQFILCFFLWAVIFLYGGYILRGVHYREDYPRVENAQEALRLKFENLGSKEDLDKLSDSIERYLRDQQSVAERNRIYSASAFAGLEPKEDD